MSRPHILITRAIAPSVVARLTEIATVDLWQEDSPMPYELLVSKARRADALLTLLTDRVDALVMDAGLVDNHRLKVISQMAVGYENIDMLAATDRGIPVGYTPGILTNATADFTWALLMAAARRLSEAERFVRAGGWTAWSPSLMLGADVHGATLGIVGFGRIGQAVARRAAGFNMRVLYHNSRTRYPDLEESMGVAYAELDTLLAQSDFVSLHTPLTPATYHLIGEAQLGRMKPTAILINVARGAVVDPAALYWALSRRIIACAALDVTDPEPLPADSPLLQLDNIIIVPHIASATTQTRLEMASVAADNIIARLAGLPLLFCANPSVYKK